MHFFIFGLWSWLASISAVRAIKNITVDDFDPRIVYSNNSGWVHENVLYLLLSLSLYHPLAGADPWLLYRVPPHLNDLILPQASQDSKRLRRSNSTAQRFTSCLTDSHHPTQTDTR